MLKSMCDTIVYRGPDDEGQVVMGPAGLGMRRLSIIDLSTGHQPISNEDQTKWIVFNGEIYNFHGLRRELEALGHKFQTHTDTETILHGYEAWGSAICKRLNGMFAFAIWDNSEQTLFLGRDRIGIKPMYYYEDSEKWLFGSEIKTILRHPNVRKEIDPAALNNYLTFEYIPSPRSIFKQVRKLPPGHHLTIRNGEKRIEPYWTLTPSETITSEGEAIERLRELVRDAVRLRLISDVPLGAFLSGGIDSTTIVSQMAGLMDQPVKTFSIGFKESSYNELKYARAVAKKYHTDHHEEMIESNVLEWTEQLIRHFDEPLGDFSIFPTYLVSKMARKYVTVCLSGDGGDELFAGYDTYKAHRFDRQYYHWLPKFAKRNMLEPLADSLSPTEHKKGLVNSYKRFIEGARMHKSLYHTRWMTFLSDMDRAALFHPSVLEGIGSTDSHDFIREYSQIAEGLDDITRMGYIDLKTYLADNILVKVDRMSMAPSLEARVPLLDYRVVEFAFSLAPNLKMNKYGTKYLLKKAFWNEFPEEVQNRDKQGFSIPIKNWIRGELKPMMLDLLDENRIRNEGLFNAPVINRWIQEHLDGRANHSHKLWALMVFEQWMDLYGK